MSEAEIVSGYTFDPYLGAVYHFDHMPRETAEEKEALRELYYIVEVVNTTHAEGGACLHFNKYFALTFKDALSIAVRLEMFSGEVAESPVKIRPATEAEETAFLEAYQHFYVDGSPDVLKPKRKKSPKR